MYCRILTLLCLILLTPATTQAAPRAELWLRWATHDERNPATIDHAAWSAWLARYRVADAAGGPARVRYAAVTATDREALRRYLQTLQALPISGYPRAEQRAYWINLYNAATVNLVLEHYPVASIRDIDISPGLFARGPWGKKLLRVEGEPLSLDDIEHRILRPVWRDPMLHYGVNCASLGCPSLAAEAYTAANTDALLAAGGRAYVNSPQGLQLQDGRLQVSSIYDWFGGDFGGSEAALIAHLRSLAAPALAAQLRGVTRISGHAYDWSLNAAP